MAIAATTLSSAVAVNDNFIKVASATSVAAGRLIFCDGEIMQVTKAYVVASTTVPVTRGQLGTVTAAHVSSAQVIHGDASDFGAVGAANVVNYPPAGRSRLVTSVSTTSTLSFAPGGVDQLVILNGTGAITLTIPAPTTDMNGTLLTLAGNGVAQHVLTFTGGLGGVGAGYTTVTFASGAVEAVQVMAVNAVWLAFSGPGWSGTVTKATAALA